MKWFIRLSLIIAELLLVIFITILLVSPATVREWVNIVSNLNLLIRLVVLIVINSILFLAILSQLRSKKAVHSGDLFVKISGVVADVNIESVRDRITKAVQSIDSISSVDAKVRSKGGKAAIELHVIIVGSQINVPKKQKEINQVVKKLVTEQLGLRLSGIPRVHIRLENGVETVKESDKPSQDIKALLVDNHDTSSNSKRPWMGLNVRKIQTEPDLHMIEEVDKTNEVNEIENITS